MGTSATRAKNKWNKENYDQFLLTMPKGKKERYKKIANEYDMSLSAFILRAVEEKIERDHL
jgi:hypothetical protein